MKVAIGALVLFVAIGLGAGLLVGSPYDVRGAGRIEVLAPPSDTHWLGTDDIGRDVAARLVHGARTSMAIALVAVGLAMLLGTAAALGAAGRPWAARVLLGACDLLGALPALLLVVAAQGLLGRASIFGLAALIALPRAADVARVALAQLDAALALPHADAARALGAGRLRLLWKHALPLALPALGVAAAATLSTAVLSEAALSFLGFGIAAPTASWGELLAQAHRNHLTWWLTVPAGVAVAAVALAANRVADVGVGVHMFTTRARTIQDSAR